jgi:hypothetical protein
LNKLHKGFLKQASLFYWDGFVEHLSLAKVVQQSVTKITAQLSASLVRPKAGAKNELFVQQTGLYWNNGLFRQVLNIKIMTSIIWQKTHSCELPLSCGLITLASGLIAKTSDPCYAKVSGLPILRALTTVILGLA